MNIIAFKSGGALVNFTGTADSSGCDIEYKWDFGDGQSDTSQNPSHNYLNPGDYKVNLTVKCKKCGAGDKTDTVKVGIADINISNPTGNPVTAGSSKNEFTYNTSSPGVLSIPVTATINPSSLAGKVGDMLRWKVTAISGSTLEWTDSWAGDSSAGKGVSPTANFTKVPSDNTAFGAKKVTLEFVKDNAVALSKTADIEVFFDKTATNNPGGFFGSGGDPNWLYYWKQSVVSGLSDFSYNSTIGFGRSRHDTCFLFFDCDLKEVGPDAPKQNFGIRIVGGQVNALPGDEAHRGVHSAAQTVSTYVKLI